MCNAKVGTSKHDTPTPTYKGRNFALPTMWSMNFGFALTTSSVLWVVVRRSMCWIGL